jgi:hypothetical protein
MYDRLHQQALRVDQNVALLAFDLLARIVARRVAVEPPCMGTALSSTDELYVASVLSPSACSPSEVELANGRRYRATALYPVGPFYGT